MKKLIGLSMILFAFITDNAFGARTVCMDNGGECVSVNGKRKGGCGSDANKIAIVPPGGGNGGVSA